MTASGLSGNHLIDRLGAGFRGREHALFAEIAAGPGAGETRSFAALTASAARIAGVLQAAGVGPGDRVAAQVEKSLTALELYLGAVMAGGVFLPLNTAYTDAEIDYFLRDAEPAAFVCDPARRATLEPAARAAGARAVFALDAAGRGDLTEAAAAAPQAAAVARGADDLAAILYTSGTTGRSKGAMLSHANLAANSEALADCWRFGSQDRLIHALPIFHTHGLFVATNVALIAGASLLFFPRFDAEAILAAMPRATAMMGVPTFYTRLLDQPGLAEAARGMRLFVSGSAPMLAETHRRWRAVTGHAVLERYGMTETNMIASNPYEGERRAGAVGFALPGVDLRIADPETGEPCAQGETGVIEVTGASVFRGYWRMPEKTAQEFRPDGWFVTGDLGRLDGEGYLWIVGRAKDLIISGGFNVYPKEVETVLDALPGVAESAVIGLPHPDFGEGVAAVVAARPGAALSEPALLEAVRPRLARYKQPRKLWIVESLPRNAMGKVQKAALRARYADAFTPAIG